MPTTARARALATIAKRGLVPGAYTAAEPYSEYDDGAHLFFTNDLHRAKEYGDGVLLRFPWPSEAKQDVNKYGRVLVGQFVSKRPVAGAAIEVFRGGQWVKCSEAEVTERFVIAQRKWLKPGSIEQGTNASGSVLVPDRRYGVFPTILAAKAGFMRQLEPALATADDAFCARHFDQQARNLRQYAVVKLEALGDAPTIQSALRRWAGDPSDLDIHIDDEIAGAPVPPSGSGAHMRAEARLLLAELKNRGRATPKLYRGDHMTPQQTRRVLLPWTDRLEVARGWSMKGAGKVYQLGEGALGICLRDYHLGLLDEGEWIVDMRSAHRVRPLGEEADPALRRLLGLLG